MLRNETGQHKLSIKEKATFNTLAHRRTGSRSFQINWPLFALDRSLRTGKSHKPCLHLVQLCVRNSTSCIRRTKDACILRMTSLHCSLNCWRQEFALCRNINYNIYYEFPLFWYLFMSFDNRCNRKKITRSYVLDIHCICT